MVNNYFLKVTNSSLSFSFKLTAINKSLSYTMCRRLVVVSFLSFDDNFY